MFLNTFLRLVATGLVLLAPVTANAQLSLPPVMPKLTALERIANHGPS
jgi:hypothetical protein